LVALAAWQAASARAVLVTLPGTGQVASVQPAPGARTAPAAATRNSCYTDCSALAYHGGSVQHAPVVRFIYWDPSNDSASLPAAYTGGLTTWLDNVVAADGSSRDIFGVGSEYYDNSGPGGSPNYISYSYSDGGAVPATDPLPTSGGCPVPSGFSYCITDAQIQAEIKSVVTAKGLPQGVNDEYVLFTPAGVDSCSSTGGSYCAYTGYCGYHSNFAGPSGTIVYANMPWLYQTACDANAVFGLGYPNAPSAPQIDPEVSVVAHELMESLTDPAVATGWFDGMGNEIGDKCSYIYNGVSYGSGSGLNTVNGADYNQTINGHDYLLQTMFADALSDGTSTGCVAITPPTAAVSLTTPGPHLTGTPIAFDGTGSSDGSPGTALSYSWTFGDGPEVATTSQPSHAFAHAGTYTVTLVVTDANHFVDSSTISVTIADAPPTASFTFPSDAAVGTPVAFDGAGSSATDGNVTSYAWDFGDGSAGAGPSPSHTYAAAGTYTVSLTVTDSHNLQSSPVTQTVTVAPAPPPNVIVAHPPTADAAVTTANPVSGQPVAFTGTGSSDPNTGGTITGYKWQFGDGSNGTGATPNHVYAGAGTYTVTLTVTDSKGLTATTTTTVTVVKPATITGVKAPKHGAAAMVSVSGAGTISIGRRHVTLTAAGTAKVALTLTRRQRAQLSRRHKLNVSVAVTFVPRAGPAVHLHARLTLAR
jgi:PKD repeat protein